MTKDEIIEMAREAGFVTNEIKSYVISPYTSEDQDLYEELEAFAKLVAEKAIKEALAQPEQEPVAKVMFVDGLKTNNLLDCDLPVGTLLYTTPPQRTWVGLTDEEIEKGRDQTFSINNPYCPCDSKTMRKAVRWAEAKLKDKNT